MFICCRYTNIAIMKTFKLLAALLVSAFLFTSCGDIVEEIHLEKNGSGTYEVYTDMIPTAVEMATEMTMKFAGAFDSTKVLDEDSIRAHATEMVWRDFPDQLDSTYSYSDGSDSVSGVHDPEGYGDRAKGFMRGGRSVGYMMMGMTFPFDDDDDLTGFSNFAEDVMEADKKVGLKGLSQSKSNVKFTYEKKKFAREMSTVEKNDLTDEEKMFFDMLTKGASGTYRTVVHTPRKIKEVKGDGIEKIEDYKVTFAYDLKEIVGGKVNMNFDITME